MWNVRKRWRTRTLWPQRVCVRPVDSGVSDGSSSWPSLTVDDSRTHTSETTHNRRASARTRLRNDSMAVSFGWCPPSIHMVIVGPLRYLTFIKCTASDPFRLSVRPQEFLSHSPWTTRLMLRRILRVSVLLLSRLSPFSSSSKVDAQAARERTRRRT